jgi:hypothetical protein
MTIKEAKSHIDRTGEAFLTFWNDQGERAFIGQVDKMTTKDGRTKLLWKLPAASHVSNFTHVMVSGKNRLYHKEDVNLRLDSGIKNFEVVWDV